MLSPHILTSTKTLWRTLSLVNNALILHGWSPWTSWPINKLNNLLTKLIIKPKMSYKLHSKTRHNQTTVGESTLPSGDAGSSTRDASMHHSPSAPATRSYSDVVAASSPLSSLDGIRKSLDNLLSRVGRSTRCFCKCWNRPRAIQHQRCQWWHLFVY